MDVPYRVIFLIFKYSYGWSIISLLLFLIFMPLETKLLSVCLLKKYLTLPRVENRNGFVAQKV